MMSSGAAAMKRFTLDERPRGAQVCFGIAETQAENAGMV